MSLWQGPPASESMKKFEGMMRPVSVCADDGANGECSPAPSSFIESGGDAGLAIVRFGSGRSLVYIALAAGNRMSSATAAWNARERRKWIAAKPTAISASAL